MNVDNWELLSEDEYKKICNVIPPKETIKYFKRNPKEFVKLRPGFRPQSLGQKDAAALLIQYRDRDFISYYVQKRVETWLNQIDEAIEEYLKEKDSKISAYINVLADSFFAKNVSAYLKLIGKRFSTNLLEAINEAINAITERKQLEKHLALAQKDNKEHEDILDKLNDKISGLEQNKKDLLENIKSKESIIDEQAQQIKSLLIHNEELFHQLKLFAEEKTKLENEIATLESTIRTQIENEQKHNQSSNRISYPLRPIEIDEFKEFLNYNLESLNIDNTICPVLSNYLLNILFCGKPIVCSQSIVERLAGCVANSLLGTHKIEIFDYNLGFNDIATLIEVLRNSGRIVVLNNFIGHIDETIILSSLNSFKDKIIFLTYVSNRTLFYVTSDFWAYANYINTSNVKALYGAFIPQEEESFFDEEKYIDNQTLDYNRREIKIFSTIMDELGVSRTVSNGMYDRIQSDLDLCGIMLFNVVPAFVEIYEKNPLNYSETLQKYIYCSQYKNIFKEWFQW